MKAIKHKDNPWFYDADKSTELFTSSLIESCGSIQGALIVGVWVADTTEDRLLDEIKNSHHKLYGEVLTYHEAYAKLEKMRIGIERHMATGKK